MEDTRLKRIETAMQSAATEKRIFHLWWHPEDFAEYPERNVDFLRMVLQLFDWMRREHGMISLSMEDCADVHRLASAAVCDGVMQ